MRLSNGKTLRRPQSVWKVGAGLAVVLLLLLLPLLFTGSYNANVLVLCCVYMTLVLGYNLLVGLTGYLSLCHHTFFAVGAYATAIGSTKLGLETTVSVVFALVSVLLLSGVVGAVLFWRVSGFTFKIVTLAFAVTAYVVASNWMTVTNGPLGIPGVVAAPVQVGGLVFDPSRPEHYYYLGLVLVGVTLIASLVIARSRFGLGLLAIRENERLAQAVGINTYWRKILVFVSASGIASLAGSYYVYYLTIATVDIFWTYWMTGLLALLLIGGAGRSMIGFVPATLLLVVGPEILRLAATYRELLYGIALLASVIFFPRGINGAWEDAWYNRRQRSRAQNVDLAHVGLDDVANVPQSAVARKEH